MKLPPIELLKAHHQFPGPFVFKVVGQTGVLKEAELTTLVQAHAIHSRVLSSRESSGGKHIAITIEALVKTPEDVHEIYRNLHKAEGLIMLL